MCAAAVVIVSLQHAAVCRCDSDAVQVWRLCFDRASRTPVFTAVKCKEASCLGKMFEEG